MKTPVREYLQLSLTTFALICFTSHAWAQASACEGLLRDGLRNVARSYSTEDIEQAAFKKHCSKKNDSWSFSDKADFMWFFRATASPNFNRSSGEEWCRENASRLDSSRVDFLEILTFSQEALRAFNACIGLQKENVLADAVIENDTLILSVWRNSGRKSYIQRFDYDRAALDCAGTGRNSDGVATTVALDKAIPLVEDFRVNVVCRRQPMEPSDDGIRLILPETTVALTTDLSTPLAITLPERLDLNTATVEELRQEIASIQAPQVILPWLPYQWDGSPRPVPNGWRICDGRTEAGPKFPDFNGLFLMGTNDSQQAGTISRDGGNQRRRVRVDDCGVKGNCSGNEIFHSRTDNKIYPPYFKIVYLCRL